MGLRIENPLRPPAAQPRFGERPEQMRAGAGYDNVPKVLQISKSSKPLGNVFPVPLRISASRASAERSALAAVGRRPPPRHTEPPGGEGVWGRSSPRFCKYSICRI